MIKKRFENLTVNELQDVYEGLMDFTEKMDSWLKYFERNREYYANKDWSEKEGINRIMFFDYTSKKDGVEFIQDEFNKIFEGYL